ncbi:hypothetical protein Dsin_016041 [Dipteronia sinensis]|uniref:Uncharacterized protein n=1 Tax=Dipteronia sinensis TaxID=43782 RepID=A0AAE0ACC2_9ROSI|nr:hypothetical protein Dsin_016041 [Dipteronia sinensis]
MAFSSSWLFNSDSSLFSSSSNDSFEKIVDGVPTGLGITLGVPGFDGDEPGLRLIGGLTISSLGLVYCLLSRSLAVCLFEPATFVAASLSDGPVKRCTISRKVFVSVWTNVVMGLQPAAPWLAGLSMEMSISFNDCSLPIRKALTCNKFSVINRLDNCRDM